MKKLIAIGLAIVMALCLPTFASAAGSTGYGSYGPSMYSTNTSSRKTAVE
ncbi:MAG: hypothetical protein K6C08_00635 [Oscillospiraceae bacterium]|nr:hypothetical protein [Oscillospiraceae bacterium]